MNKKDIYFIVLALGIIAVFVLLTVISRKPQSMQDRPEHQGVNRNTSRETCWACHGDKDTVAPLPERHPKKGKPPDQSTPCAQCHKLPASATAALFLPSVRKGQFLWPNQPQK
jgi:cytochrome c553